MGEAKRVTDPAVRAAMRDRVKVIRLMKTNPARVYVSGQTYVRRPPKPSRRLAAEANKKRLAAFKARKEAEGVKGA